MSLEKLNSSTSKPETSTSEIMQTPNPEESSASLEELLDLDHEKETYLVGPPKAKKLLLRSLTIGAILSAGALQEANAQQSGSLEEGEVQIEQLEQNLERTEEQKRQLTGELRDSNIEGLEQRRSQKLELIGDNLTMGEPATENPSQSRVNIGIYQDGQHIGDIEDGTGYNQLSDDEFKSEVRRLVNEEGLPVYPPRTERLYAYMATETNRFDLRLRDVSAEEQPSEEIFEVYKIAPGREDFTLGTIKSGGQRFASEEFKVAVTQLLEAAGEAIGAREEVEGHSFTRSLDQMALERLRGMGGRVEGNRILLPVEPFREPEGDEVLSSEEIQRRLAGEIMFQVLVIKEDTEHFIVKAHPERDEIMVITENTDGTTGIVTYPESEDGGHQYWRW